MKQENQNEAQREDIMVDGETSTKFIPRPFKMLFSPLTQQEKHLVKILEIAEIERHVPRNQQWTGRPAAERRAIARSYLVKAVLRYPHTRSLIDEFHARPNLRLICGFSKQKTIPSESTFSLNFAEFAAQELGAVVYEAVVREYLQGELSGHVSRDSTAITGREKPARKAKKATPLRKRGQPLKGEQRQQL